MAKKAKKAKKRKVARRRDPYKYTSVPPRNVRTIEAKLVLEPPHLHKLVSAVSILHSCGVDVFASGRHSDPRMNLTLADIKAQYPWLAEIGKVFR